MEGRWANRECAGEFGSYGLKCDRGAADARMVSASIVRSSIR